MILSVAPSRLDQAVGRRVEMRPGPKKPSRAGQGDLEQQLGKGNSDAIEDAQGVVEGSLDPGGSTRVHLPVEHGLAGDGDGETHHLIAHVHGCAVAPGAMSAFRIVGHDGSVALQPLGVQHGTHNPRLPGVKRSLARQQAFTEQVLRQTERASLFDMAIVGGEDVPDMVGMTEQDDFDRAEGEERHVAMFASHLRQEPQHVAAEGEELAEWM